MLLLSAGFTASGIQICGSTEGVAVTVTEQAGLCAYFTTLQTPTLV